MPSMNPSTETSGKPADIPQDVWEAASIKALGYVEWLIPAPHDYAGSEHVLTSVIARAILAAKAEERQGHDDLVDCLSDMTEHYVELAGCGDCGFWDPEAESEVIAARQMIARHRDVNTAHKNSEVQ